MFSFIKKQLKKIYDQVSSQAALIFKRVHIDDQTLQELEKLLIEADTGVKTTKSIIEKLKRDLLAKKIKAGEDLKKALEAYLLDLLQTKNYSYEADIYLLVGVNGSGKTTFAGKLGYAFSQTHQKVLFAAADTFRAAATRQLVLWAEQAKSPIIIGKEGQDPASVVYAACQTFKTDNYDKLIIDTAGRLQTKINLMKELEKIKKTVQKLAPDKKISTLLIIDSMLGQNSLIQAKLFHESTSIDGIVLTKMDGTGKGGIIFPIIEELQIPIAYISYGEKADQFDKFNSEEYIKELFEA